MIIDTHAHLNFKAFKDTYREVIQRSLDNDCWMIVVGSQYETSKRAVEIANEFPQGVYAAVGFHPCHVSDNEGATHESHLQDESRFQYDKFKALAQNPKVVAIGETGLDHFRLPESERNVGDQPFGRLLALQEELFKQQIKLAKELDKPLIVHCRDNKNKPGETYERLHKILSDPVAEQALVRLQDKPRGVVHCYVGSAEMAKKFMALGFYISFTGIVTFKNAPEVQAVAKTIPLDKLLLDTDCPYLAPEPHRGEQNEPLYTKFIAQKHAELRGITVEEVIKQTTQNAKRLFKL